MYNVIVEDLKYLSDHYYKYVIFSFEDLTMTYSSNEFIICDCLTSEKIEKLLSKKLKRKVKFSLRATFEGNNAYKYNSELSNWYEIFYYVNKNNKLMKDISFSYSYKDYCLYNFDNYSSIIKNEVYLFKDNDSYSIEELIKVAENLIFL